MKKHPFLMASLTLGAIFIFFLVVIFVIAAMTGHQTTFPMGDKVGVIKVQGPILTSDQIIDEIVNFRKDESIKAIVLRVDSPGGGVGPSQEIYEEVHKAVAVKPVVVSMGSVAASGGYYISAPASQILANPGTITGSIGVIMEFTNFEELLQKIGLKSQVVKSGEHKDIGSPVRPMTAEDKKILQGLIDDVHQQFISAVAEGRKLPEEKVRELADGRIYTGQQAKELGLVDKLGNLQDAVKTAGELAGIKEEPNVVYPPEDKPKFLDYLVEETASRIKGVFVKESAGFQYLWTGNQ